MTSVDIYAGIEEKTDALESPEGSDDDSSDDGWEHEPRRAVYDIGLRPAGDEGSGYHTKNDPREGRQWHREDITQRSLGKNAISVRCNMIDVVHGEWGPDSKDFATLVVFLFRFDIKKKSRRIARAEIAVDFFGADGADLFSRPAVQAISFEGSTSICEVKQTESTTKAVEGTAGLTGIQLAELSSTLKWEKSISRDMNSYTTIVGSRNRPNYDFGPDDQASWVLLENPTLETGVPVAFRAAVLLKREDNSPFKCEVGIKIKADLKTTLYDFFGAQEIDDPVLFNPKVKAERATSLEALRKLDGAIIGDFDVDSVGDVTFLRVREGTIKHE
ncbi:unnamed protein product [Discula destructiva]